MEDLTWRLCFAIVTTAFGSAFQHGYNIGVINAPQKYVKAFINDSRYERFGDYPDSDSVTLLFSAIVSVYCIGGMIGAMNTAFVAERFGRKNGLLINNALTGIASIFFGFSKMAKSYEMLIVGRIIIGINCGLNGGLGPMYLTEISPKRIRGAIGTIYQLMLTMSILISQILGMPEILGNARLWEVLLTIIWIPCMIMFITMPFCPESPKYLVNRGKVSEAKEALIWLRGTPDITTELDEIKQEYEIERAVPKVSLGDFKSNPLLRRPLFISIIVMLAQQFSGINTVIYYSMVIFQDAGLSEKNAYYGTVGVGVINVLVTFVSVVLVEKVGRRTLLLVGFGGTLICTILLTIFMSFMYKVRFLSYASIVTVFVFIILFAIGPGSIPWFLVSELFATGPRATATSIAGVCNWLGNFVAGLAFLPLSNKIHQYTFLIFTTLTIYFWTYIYIRVPETKNKSIAEIQENFKST